MYGPVRLDPDRYWPALHQSLLHSVLITRPAARLRRRATPPPRLGVRVACDTLFHTQRITLHLPLPVPPPVAMTAAVSAACIRYAESLLLQWSERLRWCGPVTDIPRLEQCASRSSLPKSAVVAITRRPSRTERSANAKLICHPPTRMGDSSTGSCTTQPAGAHATTHLQAYTLTRPSLRPLVTLDFHLPIPSTRLTPLSATAVHHPNTSHRAAASSTHPTPPVRLLPPPLSSLRLRRHCLLPSCRPLTRPRRVTAHSCRRLPPLLPLPLVRGLCCTW